MGSPTKKVLSRGKDSLCKKEQYFLTEYESKDFTYPVTHHRDKAIERSGGEIEYPLFHLSCSQL
jgi:hypothetical protein